MKDKKKEGNCLLIRCAVPKLVSLGEQVIYLKAPRE